MRDILSKLDNILTESAVTQGVEEAKNAAQQAAIAISKKERGEKPKNEDFQLGDDFGISFTEDFEIATEIVGFVQDGIVIELDEHAIELLAAQGLSFLEGELKEGKQKGVDGKACWDGYKRMGTKQKGGKTVDNCVKMEDHGPEDPNDPVNYGEYDREGDMAKDDLRTINGAAQELYDILSSDENLPEWVQSKITKAVDYIDTARDYMKAQKYKEGVAEGSDDLRSAVLSVIRDIYNGAQAGEDMIDNVADELGDYFNDVKRSKDQTLRKAYQLMRQQGVEAEGDPEMMAQIAKQAIDMLSQQGVAEGDVDEAKYQGREVPLGKKMAGDVKKSKVYVRKPNGNIVKVNFGDKKMRIKKSNPARRKSFRARHNCKNPGPRWKARYWSCRSW